jgi:CRISPR-associated endonuclease/helicase Cas3
MSHAVYFARPGQPLGDHSSAVAELASRYGGSFGAAETLRVAGLLHDLGKASPEFQAYMFNEASKRGEVPHSVYGARKAYDSISFAPLAEMLANCIAAHHGRLNDNLSPAGDTPLLDNIKNTEDVALGADVPHIDSDALKSELDSIVAFTAAREKAFGLSMFTRLLYSCLVDADRWDAHLFESKKRHEDTAPDWAGFLSTLERSLGELESGPDTEMSRLRRKLSSECARAGRRAQGIYRLEAPTGSGKTLSSLRFALEHARAHDLERIIYVIPYLSITSQTAETIRKALGADSETVLEHHSNFMAEGYEDEKAYRLHTDRWDAPIVLTTQVQFLESVFSAKASNLRKLHNMARSVIIFDEAQSLPLKCVYLFNGAINFLHSVCSSTILLCTATQPLLDSVEYPALVSQDSSIADCGDAPKRYEIVDAMTKAGYSYAELAEFVLQKHESSTLTVVNTKAAAKALYVELKRGGTPALHLSTGMCPAHRDAVIDELRRRLKVGEPVICVSTQLIEAGVDISFECVVRDIAGLDSIYQAAGRCNRHGEFGGVKDVYVVNIAGEKLDKLPDIKIGAEKTMLLFAEKSLDINTYYKHYFHARKNQMDYPLKGGGSVYDMLSGNLQGRNAYRSRKDKQGAKPPALVSAIRSAGDEFYVIDRGRTDVIVPYGEAEKLLAEFDSTEDFAEKRKLLRKLGRYSVSLYKYQLDALEKAHALHTRKEDGLTVLARGFYEGEFGVNLEGAHEFLNA